MQIIDELRTERLILDRISSHDIENVASLYGDYEVMSMLGGSWTLAQTQVEVKKQSQHWTKHGFGPWIVRHAISNRFVGLSALLQERIEESTEVHIGYVLMREFWGQGFATELARAITDVGFSVVNCPSLVCYTVPTNLRARRVVEKAGFSFERNFSDKKGVPQVLYRLTQAMWRERQIAPEKRASR